MEPTPNFRGIFTPSWMLHPKYLFLLGLGGGSPRAQSLQAGVLWACTLVFPQKPRVPLSL